MTEKPEPFPTASAAAPRRPRERRWLRRALASMVGLGVAVAGLPGQALAAPAATPPVIHVDITPSHGTGVWDGWYSVPRTFRVRGTGEAGVSRVSYRLTGAQTGEAEAEGSQIEGEVRTEGVTLITMTATDPFGNVATRTYGVGIDLTDPTAEITGLGGGAILEGEEHRATFSCADPGGAILSCTATNSNRPFASGDLIDTSFGIKQVVVTAVDRVGRTTTTRFAYGPLRRQTVTKNPAVSGSPRVGDTLRITSGAVTPTTAGTTSANQWYVDGKRVAEGDRLVLTPEHLGKRVACDQTFNNAAHLEVTAPCTFAGGATSAKVLAATWTLRQRPRITGKAGVGMKLHAIAPLLSAPAAAHRYQWLRNGRPIRSATTATYRLRKADRGRRITVRVSSSARDQPTLVTTSAAKRVRR